MPSTTLSRPRVTRSTAAPRSRVTAPVEGTNGHAPATIDVALLKKVAASHNLTPALYDGIVRLLGRQPTLTEVGIFGVMYSEHCSYGSSKPYLKQFPTKGKRILVSAGEENAGLVDIGDGLAVAFKVESHNHPSAVEPHAGAATGVGGIIRDIFTMGARPIALLDSLRFGPLTDSRTRFLLQGVVKGIADYGNAVGVPTVGGEVQFDRSYQDNPLVNVMCLGLVKAKEIARAAAKGVGNPVIYVGSSTGRDGLGGASFASRELTDASDADRPAVQIGDPFAEKCLIEATLEALATGHVLGIQDMGAAGLTCSTCETAARGHVGIEIDILKVPRRETGMTPYEVMLSESQERMLLIARRGREASIIKLFAKWGLNAVVIGRVTPDGRMRVNEGHRTVADIPARALTDHAPVFHRPVKRPAYLTKAQRLSPRSVPVPKDLAQVLRRLLASPTIADKSTIFEQYDHMVQTNTAVLPGRGDAAVLRIKGTTRWLAAATDGTGRYGYLDPAEGGRLAVAEAARNVACVGATPLAVTDCLNFGSPQDPEVMWQFKESVKGISEACRAFKIPVTGGNVSFYNEGPRAAIDPTPVIGVIGLVEGPSPVSAVFQADGDAIILLGQTREELGGSEYLSLIHHRKAGRPPRVDFEKERALQELLPLLAGEAILRSAHDCSDGGLAVALAECCVMSPERRLGARVDLSLVAGPLSRSTQAGRGRGSLRPDAVLFGESAGRVILSCEPRHVGRVRELAVRRGLRATVLGRIGGSRFTLAPWIDLHVDEVNAAWRSGLPDALQTGAA